MKFHNFFFKVAQYVGEICRYLYLVPPKPTDTQHKVRLMTGNGMKPNIWQKFVDRFKIANIVEFYGATEANSNMVNFAGKVGAVGFLPHFASLIVPNVLVKCDETTGEIIRNEKGKCIKVETGEPGVFLGGISKRDQVRAFNGYTDKVRLLNFLLETFSMMKSIPASIREENS